MTAIASVGGIGGMTPLKAPTLNPSAGTPGAGAPSFQNGLESVQKSLNASDAASAQVATGTATDLHQVTIAATKAQLGVQLTVAMRDKAVDAYQEIMRMSV
jgi:flagellar hook-basal body complex protein FliE